MENANKMVVHIINTEFCEYSSNNCNNNTYDNNIIRLRGGSDRSVAVEKPKPLPFRAINTRRANAMRYILLDYIKEKPTRDMRGLYVVLSKDKRKAMENIAAEALFQKKDVYPPQERFYSLNVKPTGDIYYIPEKKIDQMAYVVNRFRKESNESIISDISWGESDTDVHESDEIVDLKTHKIYENIEKAEHLVDLLEQYTFVDKDDYKPPIIPIKDSISKPYRSIYESTSTATTLESFNRIIPDKYEEICPCISQALLHPKSTSKTILTKDGNFDNKPCPCVSDLLMKNKENFSIIAHDDLSESTIDDHSKKKHSSNCNCDSNHKLQEHIAVSPNQSDKVLHQEQKVKVDRTKKQIPDIEKCSETVKEVKPTFSKTCFEIIQKSQENLTNQLFEINEEPKTVEIDISNNETDQETKTSLPSKEIESQQKQTGKQTSKRSKCFDPNQSDSENDKNDKNEMITEVCLTNPKFPTAQIRDTIATDHLQQNETVKILSSNHPNRESQHEIIVKMPINPNPSQSKQITSFCTNQEVHEQDTSIKNQIRKREILNSESSENVRSSDSINPESESTTESKHQHMYHVTGFKMKPIYQFPVLNTTLLECEKECFTFDNKNMKEDDALELQYKSKQKNLDNLSDVLNHKEYSNKQEILKKSSNIDLPKHKKRSSSRRQNKMFHLPNKSNLHKSTSDPSQEKLVEKQSTSSADNLSLRKRHSFKDSKSMSHLNNQSEINMNTTGKSNQKKLPNTSTDLTRQRKRKSAKHERKKSMSRLSGSNVKIFGKSIHRISNSSNQLLQHKKHIVSRHSRSMTRFSNSSELNDDTSNQSIQKQLPNISADLLRHKKRESSSTKSVCRLHSSEVPTYKESEQNLPDSHTNLCSSRKHTSSKYQQPTSRHKTESRNHRRKSISPKNKSQLIEGTSKQNILEKLPHELSRQSVTPCIEKSETKLSLSKQNIFEKLIEGRANVPKYRKRTKRRRQTSLSHQSKDLELILDKTIHSTQETLPDVSIDTLNQYVNEVRQNRRKSTSPIKKSEPVAIKMQELTSKWSDVSTDLSMEERYKSKQKQQKSILLINTSKINTIDKLKEFSDCETLHETQKKNIFSKKFNTNPDTSISQGTYLSSTQSNKYGDLSQKIFHKTIDKLSETQSRSLKPTYTVQSLSSINNSSIQLVPAESSTLPNSQYKPQCNLYKSNPYKSILRTNESEVSIDLSKQNYPKKLMSEAQCDFSKSNFHTSNLITNESEVFINTSKQNHSTQLVIDAKSDLVKPNRHRNKSVAYDDKFQFPINASKQTQPTMSTWINPSSVLSIQNAGRPQFSESFRLHEPKLVSSTNLLRDRASHSKLEIDKLLVKHSNNSLDNIHKLPIKPTRDSKFEIDKLFNDSKNSSRHRFLLSVSPSKRYDFVTESSKLDEKINFSDESEKLEHDSVCRIDKPKHTSRHSRRHRDKTELKATKEKSTRHNKQHSKHRIDNKMQENQFQNRQPNLEHKNDIFTMTKSITATNHPHDFMVWKHSEHSITAERAMTPESALIPEGIMISSDGTIATDDKTLPNISVIPIPPSNRKSPIKNLTSENIITPEIVNISMEHSTETPDKKIYDTYNMIGIEQDSPDLKSISNKIEEEGNKIKTHTLNKKSKSILSILRNKIQKTVTTEDVNHIKEKPSISHDFTSKTITPENQDHRLKSHKHTGVEDSVSKSVSSERRHRHGTRSKSPKNQTDYNTNVQDSALKPISPEVKHHKTHSKSSNHHNKRKHRNEENPESRHHHRKRSKSSKNQTSRKHKFEENSALKTLSPELTHHFMTRSNSSQNQAKHEHRDIEDSTFKSVSPISKHHNRRSKSPKEHRRHKPKDIKDQPAVDLNLVKQKLNDISFNEHVTDDCELQHSKHNLLKKISSKNENSSHKEQIEAQILTSPKISFKSTKKSDSVSANSNVTVLQRVRKIKKHADENNSKDNKSGYERINFSSVNQDQNSSKILKNKRNIPDDQTSLDGNEVEVTKSPTKMQKFNLLFKKKSKESSSSKSSISKATESFLQILKKHSKNSRKEH